MSNFLKVSFIFLFLFFSGLRVSFGQEIQNKQPNIVFILIDDQRYDFLSYLDHPWIETPNIDELAKNSMYFENAFVTTSLCSPSRASILTGQYAHKHKVLDNDTALPSIIPTFPKKLQKAGYKTGFIGKWHMGGDNDMPRPGFDRWVSFKGQGEYYDPTLNIDSQRVEQEGYITDILTELSVDFIKENKKTDKPYLLYLSHKAVHEDFSPAERHKGHYQDLSIPKPDNFVDSEENYDGKPLWVKRQRTTWHGAERDYSIHDYGNFNHFFQLYSEAMLAVDESVGKIKETLSELGQLDETVIIFYSDNGYMIGEHGLIDKRVMYEESIRVPAFVHWPQTIQEPVKKEEFILNIDIAPTILDLAGIVVPPTMQGKSFVPLIKDQPVNWRTDFLYEYFLDPVAPETPTIFGLRNQKYSYMTYKGIWDINELYDMENDPQQNHNLLGDITLSNKYGPFEWHLQRQDPELWSDTIKKLDTRLQDLIYENEGTLQPSWNQE